MGAWLNFQRLSLVSSWQRAQYPLSVVLKKKLKYTSWHIGREWEARPGMGLWNPKAYLQWHMCSNKATHIPIRLYILILLKQCYSFLTRHSNIWVYGRYSFSNHSTYSLNHFYYWIHLLSFKFKLYFGSNTSIKLFSVPIISILKFAVCFVFICLKIILIALWDFFLMSILKYFLNKSVIYVLCVFKVIVFFFDEILRVPILSEVTQTDDEGHLGCFQMNIVCTHS